MMWRFKVRKSYEVLIKDHLKINIMKKNIFYFFIITLLLFQCNNPQNNNLIKVSESDGYISVNDSIEIYYQFIGSGEDTIVFLHGGPGLPSYYLMADLKPLAFQNTLLFYDQRGCGKSTPIKDTSLLDASYYPQDLEIIRKYFKMQKMILVGHSWGGILAGLYASQYPKHIDRMVLIGSVPPVKIPAWDDFGPNFDAKFDSTYLKEVYQTWEDRFHREDSIKACWDNWTHFIKGYYSNPVLTRRMWGDVCNCPLANSELNYIGWTVTMESLSDWDFSENLSTLDCPVLVMHGEDDPIPLECAKSWSEILPNVQLSIFKNAGHFPQVESPELFFQQINQFFNGTWPVDTVIKPDEPDKQIQEKKWGIYTASLQIKSVNKKFMEGIYKHDASSLLNLYTTDAIVLAPTAPPIQGHLTIEAFWQSAIDKGLSKAELQTMDLEGDNKKINEIGKYTLYGKNDEILDIGKYLIIWENENGKWLMSKDMFNTSMKKPSRLYEWEKEYLF